MRRFSSVQTTRVRRVYRCAEWWESIHGGTGGRESSSEEYVCCGVGLGMSTQNIAFSFRRARGDSSWSNHGNFIMNLLQTRDTCTPCLILCWEPSTGATSTLTWKSTRSTVNGLGMFYCSPQRTYTLSVQSKTVAPIHATSFSNPSIYW